MTDATDPRDRILDAALALLETEGAAAVTTAALAREARCSKSTLYAAFTDRDAILAALVERQADTLNSTLDAALAAEAGIPPRDALAKAGEALLALLTSDAALAINRAAISEPSGVLSGILIASGRARSAPRIVALIERLRDEGVIAYESPAAVYRAFYGLLISDRQILALHRVHGARPSPEESAAIAQEAVSGIEMLFHPNQ